MKTFKIKNYKGNIVESLKRFSELHEGMKVVRAFESNDSLKILAEDEITLKNLDANTGFNDIAKDLGDDSLEHFCAQLDFLVKSDDPKARALYDTFRKGWKDKYRNIKVRSEFVNIYKLHPTQNVIYAKKSLKAILNGTWKIAGADFAVDKLLGEDSPQIEMGDPIIICKIKGVNYLIDGHHRWSKVYAFNPNATMKAYVIDESFSSADEVLKFAQGTLTALRNKSPINGNQPEEDFNMYLMGQSELINIVNEFLSDEVLEHIKNAEVTKGVIDDKKTLITYLWGNIRTMRRYAPKGEHSREFMPQFPDGDTNPKNAVNNIK